MQENQFENVTFQIPVIFVSTWMCLVMVAICTQNHHHIDSYPRASLFTKKTPSYGYRDPHYKPKTFWRLSQVYNRNPYTDKMASS